MYEIGAMVFYGGEGVCRVEAVGPLEMSGASQGKEYYTLAPLYRTGRVYTPVGREETMRPVLSRREAEELVRSIPSLAADDCSRLSLRVLNEHYRDLIHTRTCEDMVRVIKSAYAKGAARRSRGAAPNQMDERYLKRAEELLYGELAVVLDIPREEVAGYIAAEAERQA